MVHQHEKWEENKWSIADNSGTVIKQTAIINFKTTQAIPLPKWRKKWMIRTRSKQWTPVDEVTTNSKDTNCEALPYLQYEKVAAHKYEVVYGAIKGP